MKLTNIPSLGLAGLAALAGISLPTPVFAVVNIDYVTVGNLSNAADPTIGRNSTGSLYGAVSYAYNIGKYEVTNAQYAEFLNAKGASNSNGIFNSSMASYGITQTGSSGSFSYSVTSGFGNKPVVFVSWFDAARFTNWLGNGQGSGDMETGAYTLSGATSGIITVNSGATVYLPSEDEWYKAAYYNGDTASYSLYPNGQNSITTADANYGNSVGASTDVGTYSDAASFYGTFDQGGNVWEWNDLLFGETARGIRGASWINDGDNLGSSYRNVYFPQDSSFAIGFRVASVPEPSVVVTTLAAFSMMFILRKRKSTE